MRLLFFFFLALNAVGAEGAGVGRIVAADKAATLIYLIRNAEDATSCDLMSDWLFDVCGFGNEVAISPPSWSQRAGTKIIRSYVISNMTLCLFIQGLPKIIY